MSLAGIVTTLLRLGKTLKFLFLFFFALQIQPPAVCVRIMLEMFNIESGDQNDSSYLSRR